MTKIERRSFIKKTAIAAAGAGAIISGCGKNDSNKSAAVISNKSYEWKMVTAWPPHFPILGELADKLAKEIETMSQGRLKIHVYGGGELVPPFEAFDAVTQGVAEMAHSASYYWAGKSAASQFFTSVPFGMNTQETYSWLYYGGGLELWNELYDKFNLIPFPAGNTGAQMGGWFNKKIDSINDLKGLKIRMPGLGGKVITKAGSTAILSPGGEIYTNLERGVIDATEWIGPYHDYLMGFHKISKYYYAPSWSEPTGLLELMVNKTAFNNLSDDLKQIVEKASRAMNTTMVAYFDQKNVEYLNKIKAEGNVEIKRFPEEVMNYFREKSKEVIDEITESDEMSRRIIDSYSKFQAESSEWTTLSSI